MNKIIIEKEKLLYNIDVIQKQAMSAVLGKGRDVPQIIAVLKNNAYGISYEIMAQALLENHINFFAVTDVYEALKLKPFAKDADILIMNSTSIEEEVKIIVENNFIASCGSYDAISMLERTAQSLSKEVRFHLNIDTGMSRFGFRADELLKVSMDEEESTEKLPVVKLANRLKSLENSKLEGIYTHFQQAYDKKPDRTKEQFNLFLNVINRLRERGIEPKIKHCCNTSAFFKYSYMHLDAVRVGSAFTGRCEASIAKKLKRVGYLESEICEIREIKKGDKVFYSGMYKAKEDMKVGVVEAGYGDGIGRSGPIDEFNFIHILRRMKNDFTRVFADRNVYVTVRGQKCKVLGRVGLRNFVCDLSNVEAIAGDRVKIDIPLTLCDSGIERGVV